jgi:hypothetical protein
MIRWRSKDRGGSRAAVGLHADQFVEIKWLALGRKFLGLGFGP